MLQDILDFATASVIVWAGVMAFALAGYGIDRLIVKCVNR